MNWRNEVIHASDCRCQLCNTVITPEEELAISEFIDAQFEADLLEEVEDVEVL